MNAATVVNEMDSFTTGDGRRVRVVIVEDRRQVREGLAVLVAATEGFAHAAGFSSMEETLERIAAVQVDLALVDLGLPGMSGIEGIRILRARYPEMPILALTIYDDDERVFQALCAGASGYLLKTASPERLRDALKEVVAGGAPLSPEIARRVVRLFREFGSPQPGGCRLTSQETELLRLLVNGHLYKTAAEELGVSVNTISFHLKNIYAKLQVHSKSEAVAKALRQRLV